MRTGPQYIGGFAPTRDMGSSHEEDLATANRSRDTGPGIPPAMAESIFEPHVRVPGSGQPGFGLGLATVKRMAEAAG